MEVIVECDIPPSALLIRFHLQVPGASARAATDSRGGVGGRGVALVSEGVGRGAGKGAVSHSGRSATGSGRGDDGNEYPTFTAARGLLDEEMAGDVGCDEAEAGADDDVEALDEDEESVALSAPGCVGPREADHFAPTTTGFFGAPEEEEAPRRDRGPVGGALWKTGAFAEGRIPKGLYNVGAGT